MNTDRFRDDLLDVFLAEEVGDRMPPDMSQEILTRALGAGARREQIAGRVGRPAPSGARRRWEVAAAVAATFFIATVVLRVVTLSRYPGPYASGDYSVVAGDTVQRGATIRTESGSAVLQLGGYCRVDIRPWTTLRIEGSEYAEEIFVDTGTAVCSVDPKVGEFVASAELGTVVVRGTEFTVNVAEADGRRSMWVKVTRGSVEVRDVSGSEVLSAGQEWVVDDVPDRPETQPGHGPTDPPSEGAKDRNGFSSEADAEPDPPNGAPNGPRSPGGTD